MKGKSSPGDMQLHLQEDVSRNECRGDHMECPVYLARLAADEF